MLPSVGTRMGRGGEVEQLVKGEDLWREWKGEAVERTGWWKEQHEAQGGMGMALERVITRDKVYDKG